ncbi:branched-chain amino acid ABC transporter permease [Bacillus sp. FJAT-50079]|uniref:branched-chain amino acid ABC transporter permease n=1 Tax=Bacillus sp. FJAT-50079 TaxID=2833577 RepID=UPI001BCA4FF9|nr:branched-chain amino acid ABC transporter permease [Bacillus sp. FJAT-50079]MBS4210586.1 branched-chain amino acid ABC transporter permease [Bacillus sp. FJAT-50079]
MTLSKKRIALILAFVSILIITILPNITHSSFYTYLSILIFINIIGAVSLNLIIKMGQVSISHAAFMAIGGYLTAILATRTSLPFIVTFIITGIVAVIIGLLVGRVFLRLRGDYFILGTFAFGEFVTQVIINNKKYLGGANGITGIPAPRMPFASLPFTEQIQYYYLALIVMVIILVLVFMIYRSPVGRILDSMKESEDLTQSLGINTVFYKVFIYAVGGGMVALGGSIFAYFMHYVSPFDFRFTEATGFILMNVIGGRFSLLGPIIGAVLITPLPEFFRQFVQYQVFLYGAVVVLFVLYMPRGIVGLFERKRKKTTVSKIQAASITSGSNKQ